MFCKRYSKVGWFCHRSRSQGQKLCNPCTIQPYPCNLHGKEKNLNFFAVTSHHFVGPLGILFRISVVRLTLAMGIKARIDVSLTVLFSHLPVMILRAGYEPAVA